MREREKKKTWEFCGVLHYFSYICDFKFNMCGRNISDKFKNKIVSLYVRLKRRGTYNTMVSSLENSGLSKT